MTRSKVMQAAITIDRIKTPLGEILLAADGKGRLHAADFADYESRMRSLLDRRLGKLNYDLHPGRVPATIKTAFKDYFAGDLAAIRDMTLKTGGTSFQDSVWTALRKIRPGQPLSYSALARRLGKPQSARAVGHANGANPFCIVVPCHRLVGANGDLTGYAGGIERKRWLLDHEARHAAKGA